MMDIEAGGDMRSQCRISERNFDLEQQQSTTTRNYSRGLGMTSTIRRGLRMKRLKSSAGKETGGSRKNVLDPQNPFLKQWFKVFVVSCTLALFVDPLFCYIFVIDNKRKCLGFDDKLKIIACILRSFIDLFYIFDIILQFRTGYVVPSSEEFSRKHFWAILKRFLFTSLTLDILAALPLPQVVILIIAPRVNGPASFFTRWLLKIATCCQYPLRYYKIVLFYIESTRHSRMLPENRKAGAVFYLLSCILASNVVGAYWYSFAIERADTCWRESCFEHDSSFNGLYCGVPRTGDYSFLNTSCPLLEPNEIKKSTDFNFGIYLEALQSGLVENQNFHRKFFYCFWWGLRNLSSLGQNLRTSSSIMEINFAICIFIVGLVLFALLIHSIQNYAQFLLVKGNERQGSVLPANFRPRIKEHEQHTAQQIMTVEADINRHLCYDLLTRVPMFAKMDDQLINALCDHLKPVILTENSFIYREGEPVDKMLFLTRGVVLSMTKHDGRTSFSVDLKPGDHCGEELISWALDPNSCSLLPTSTKVVQSVNGVEAFALMADDLRLVASQFRRCKIKQVQHIFRFHSDKWRIWAARIIQAAWRQNHRKKSLWKNGARTGTSANPTAITSASNFSASVPRHQKPPEPDFGAETSRQ